MRFAPYVRISSLICCGTVRQIAASPNSVTVPTIEATTAMMARERRRNTAPNTMVRNMRRFVIRRPALRSAAMKHLRGTYSQDRTDG